MNEQFIRDIYYYKDYYLDFFEKKQYFDEKTDK